MGRSSEFKMTVGLLAGAVVADVVLESLYPETPYAPAFAMPALFGVAMLGSVVGDYVSGRRRLRREMREQVLALASQRDCLDAILRASMPDEWSVPEHVDNFVELAQMRRSIGESLSYYADKVRMPIPPSPHQ